MRTLVVLSMHLDVNGGDADNKNDMYADNDNDNVFVQVQNTFSWWSSLGEPMLPDLSQLG